LHLARAYLTASDPAFVERTWQAVMEQLQSRGKPFFHDPAFLNGVPVVKIGVINFILQIRRAFHWTPLLQINCAGDLDNYSKKTMLYVARCVSPF
jgi:hypothetical protein